MIRYVRVTLVLWTAVATAAIDAGHWVQVEGGTWNPSSTILSELEATLKPVVTAASQNRGRLAPWNEYTFQYQGRRTLLGRRFVYVNAFCVHEDGDLRREWIDVDDGGACFFRAKFDPEKKLVYDVEVNGVA